MMYVLGSDEKMPKDGDLWWNRLIQVNKCYDTGDMPKFSETQKLQIMLKQCQISL